MSEYLTLDADPFISTGVPATPEQVDHMLSVGLLNESIIEKLTPEQRPDVEDDTIEE